MNGLPLYTQKGLSPADKARFRQLVVTILQTQLKSCTLLTLNIKSTIPS